jgi:hypothetical protein
LLALLNKRAKMPIQPAHLPISELTEVMRAFHIRRASQAGKPQGWRNKEFMRIAAMAPQLTLQPAK